MFSLLWVFSYFHALLCALSREYEKEKKHREFAEHFYKFLQTSTHIFLMPWKNCHRNHKTRLSSEEYNSFGVLCIGSAFLQIIFSDCFSLLCWEILGRGLRSFFFVVNPLLNFHHTVRYFSPMYDTNSATPPKQYCVPDSYVHLVRIPAILPGKYLTRS